MRSKDVDEAIERCKYIIENSSQWYLGPDNPNAIDTVLSYIEELEEENRKLTNRYCIGKITDLTGAKLDEALSHNYINKKVIRDKIKDIEMQIKGEKTKIYTIPECFLILKTLKSIIGE